MGFYSFFFSRNTSEFLLSIFFSQLTRFYLLHVAGFFKVKKLRQKKRMHTCAFQVMQKLVRQANLWEYEETGSQPLDLKEIRGGDKDAKVGALEISPLNIPDEVQPKMGGSAMNQDHQVAAGASTSTGAKKTEDANGTLFRLNNYISTHIKNSRGFDILTPLNLAPLILWPKIY